MDIWKIIYLRGKKWSELYDLSYIHLYSSPSTGLIKNSQSEQLPVGLIAQLVEHFTGIAKVMGSRVR